MSLSAQQARAAAPPSPDAPAVAARSLYLCYFGLREPLVQTQVLPYLRQLRAAGIEVGLLTYEPELRRRWSAAELTEARARLAADGIKWFYLPYHKRPTLPATLYDVAAGALLAARYARRPGSPVVLHGRGHIGALIGALAKRLSGARLLFDIRGFMPEEYTDAGVWPAGGYLYRGTKRVERYLLANSDAFVVLTERARAILFADGAEQDARGRPVEVIPCCVDPARFDAAESQARADVRRELGLTERRVFVYVGSFGGWYMTDEMSELLAAAHRQDARTYALILTQSEPTVVVERLRAAGLSAADSWVGRVAPADVPRYLRAADVAVSFIKPCYSKLSSSPTKIAEYLAAGLPVICNAGVGDLDELITTDRVGVLVREFDAAAYAAALAELAALQRDPELSARCRASAWARFDLIGVGGARYQRLYRRLLQRAENGSMNGRPRARAT
jgi:glycosyltransferase involved in cell wall biosynthesis